MQDLFIQAIAKTMNLFNIIKLEASLVEIAKYRILLTTFVMSKSKRKGTQRLCYKQIFPTKQRCCNDLSFYMINISTQIIQHQ